MDAVTLLSSTVGIEPACLALGVARASYYRQRPLLGPSALEQPLGLNLLLFTGFFNKLAGQFGAFTRCHLLLTLIENKLPVASDRNSDRQHLVLKFLRPAWRKLASQQSADLSGLGIEHFGQDGFMRWGCRSPIMLFDDIGTIFPGARDTFFHLLQLFR
jgi:hypothetical protein